jgi:hypothetical protein
MQAAVLTRLLDAAGTSCRSLDPVPDAGERSQVLHAVGRLRIDLDLLEARLGVNNTPHPGKPPEPPKPPPPPDKGGK